MRYLRDFIFYLYSSSLLAGASTSNCKCTPNSPCWPSESDWSSLNTTISGTLIRGVPPASVCYSDQPNYDEEACSIVRSQWFNSTWHAEDPISIDYPIWANNSCNPIYPNGTSVTGEVDAGAKGCSIGNYPIYVVNATNAKHVSEAFKWAAKKNIRVVIKSTGHSFPGRSTGYGSLSIWTHNFRGISYIPSFQPTSCPINGTQAAARIAAGHTGVEVQSEMADHDAIIVTGANPDVGLIGWLTGGGHGTLSSTYGMGADNLLEATIVTPNGKVLLANPCHNPDIFFAIRGGGGGTFGVVLEAVVKAFPTPGTTYHVLQIGSLSPETTTEFWDLMGFVHSRMPGLKAGGMQGYYYMVGPPVNPTLAFIWLFYLFDKPLGTVERLIAPIEQRLKQQAGLFVYLSDITQSDTYWDSWGTDFQNEAVADTGMAFGSRLLSPESLSDPNITAKVFEEIGPNTTPEAPNAPFINPTLIGHMIGPANPASYSPSTLSRLPAWDDTLVHLIVASPWPPNTPRSGIDSVYADVTRKANALRELSPDTGAYFNEADSYEPEWQESFWGSNYERLLNIKRKYDPHNLLWCQRCVGSEALVEIGDGRLCWAKGEEKGRRTEDGRGGKRNAA
ncbi:FAD binding domain-containing protein [Melanomma pulvis-pyrius CBS 109.77]|uniref:FAD binding domain-containing protein n=1 Tax=Melanomma pulvis-pyrius CBS 109.77 TaxID=1314802 RepID=A0A6A6XGD7_9PLEO|nr:FAD binding domain-containing protein [Melanomma pulvis-pyrius CBS 109.77]